MKLLITMNPFKFAFLVLFGFFFFISCEKDEANPIIEQKDERFPINFMFVNTMDKSLMALNFEVRTYFPIQDKSNIHYKYFPDVMPFDTITMIVDTITTTLGLGYISCVTQMEINVYLDINDT